MTRQLRFLTGATLVVCAGLAPSAGMAQARFWLTTTGAPASGPVAPPLALKAGDTTAIEIWARPSTDLRLRNVSLNLVADATGLDFVDGAFTVHNAMGTATRFGDVKDSGSGSPLLSDWSELDVSLGSVDAIDGLLGFTILHDADTRGLGPECDAADSNCVTASDALPAWRLATIGVKAVGVGTVNLRLQIGDLGISEQTTVDGDYDNNNAVDTDDYLLWQTDFGSTTDLAADGNHDGVVDAADYTLWRDNYGAMGSIGTAAMTDVVLGVDTLDGMPEPTYNAGNLAHRSVTLAMDDPDMVVTIAAPLTTAAPEPATALGLLSLLVLVSGRRQ